MRSCFCCKLCAVLLSWFSPFISQLVSDTSLSLFLENQNQIILKETIIEKIWDSNENYVDEHTLLVNISRLRNKIEDDKHHYIKTVYGLGYRWCHDE